MLEPDRAITLLSERNLGQWYEADPAGLTEIEAAIIASASLPQGYQYLTWQGCTQLLAQAPRGDFLFRECVIPAIIEALRSSLRNGEWYRSLGFIALPQPPGMTFGDMLSGYDLSDIADPEGKTLESWQLSPDLCRGLSQAVLHQIALFLVHATEFGLAWVVRYQASAALLMALDPSGEDFGLAAEVFLDSLVEAKSQALTFVMWRSLANIAPSLTTESKYLVYLRDYIENGLKDGIGFRPLVVTLAEDELLLQACTSNDDLCIGLGILVYHGIQLGENSMLSAALFRLLQGFSSVAPAITEAIRIRLSEHRNSDGSDVADVARFEGIMEEVKSLLERRRIYRGLALAQDIWRYNVTEVFTPLQQELCSGHLRRARDDLAIDRLDARRLVEDCPPQRENLHPIEGDVLLNLIRDTGEILELIREASSILSHSAQVLASRPQVSDSNSLLEVELRKLAAMGPLSTWAVERFLKMGFC